ncbi:MAG: hypothetical protein WEC34_07485 [Acidimicrobiia bacterium]
MDPSHRPSRETVAPEVAIEGVDLRGRQLTDDDATEVRYEVAPYDALDLANRARRPVRRCGRDPFSEKCFQRRSGSRAWCVRRVVDKLCQRVVRGALRAAHRPGGVATLASLNVGTEVDAQLPGAAPPLPHRPTRHGAVIVTREDDLMGKSWASDGQLPPVQFGTLR